MVRIIAAVGVFAVFGFSYEAHATDYDVTFCIRIETAFTDDDVADYWIPSPSGTDLRIGRGNFLVVDTLFAPNLFEDYVDDQTGCETIRLSSTQRYHVYSLSKSEVNGVGIHVFDDFTSPAYYAYVHYPAVAGYQPTGNTTVYLDLPAGTDTGPLAVASFMMSRDNMGLSAWPLVYYDDDCCYADETPYENVAIWASTTSRTVIAHETGHAILALRDGRPEFNYNLDMVNCNAEGAGQNYHGVATREYQSAAFVEGFADLMSVWTWNNSLQSNCDHDKHYTSDFDLDGVIDNQNLVGLPEGYFNCEGIPVTGLPSYVTSRDWLEDLTSTTSDPLACALGTSGNLTNQGTPYDWLRYGWDMIQDEGVPIHHMVDIWDDCNTHSWDPDGGTSTTSDDPTVLWASKAALHSGSYGDEHNNQKDNGLDH